jgi:hypothetical protein
MPGAADTSREIRRKWEALHPRDEGRQIRLIHRIGQLQIKTNRDEAVRRASEEDLN